jgi:hypothetical protein
MSFAVTKICGDFLFLVYLKTNTMQTTISKSIAQLVNEYQNLLAETISKYENKEISFKEVTSINKEAAIKWKEIQALKKAEKTKIKKRKMANGMSAISFDQLYYRTFLKFAEINSHLLEDSNKDLRWELSMT